MKNEVLTMMKEKTMNNYQLAINNEKIKERKMSIVKLVVLSLLIAHCSLLICTCSDIFNPPGTNDKLIKDGYGFVRIGIVGGSERTVFPGKVFDSYIYTFTEMNGEDEGDSQVLSPNEQGLFALKLGDWKVTVQAFIGDDEAANGSGRFTLNAAGYTPLNVEIILNAAENSGEGIFSYHITFPAGADITHLSMAKLPELTAEIPLDQSETAISGTASDIPAGYYLLVIQLKKDVDGSLRYTGREEVIHIYDKLTTVYGTIDEPIEFTDADFSSYLVTFDTDGGSSVKMQTVPHGGKVSVPAEPNKTFILEAGLYRGGPENFAYIFDGWLNDDIPWDFDSGIIISDLTLTAKWNDLSVRVEEVPANDFDAARSHINSDAGIYTLVIDEDISVNGTNSNTFSAANINVTIIGIKDSDGKVPALNLSSQGCLLYIAGINQTVTIRDITLQGLEDNNVTLVYLNATSAHFIMEEGTLITGNINTNVTATSAGGVTISQGIFTMKGGVISGNSSVSSNAGGGLHLGNTASNIFRISNGIITGNEPYTPPDGTIPLAANTAPNIGSALRITNGTVQYGTFNGADLVPNGSLTTRHTTIHVIDGEVLIPTITNTYEWQSARDTISNSGNGTAINPRTYNIIVRGNVSGITGSTANTFGSAAYIDVTITGENNAALNLSSQGNLLRYGANQSVTIRDITLQGLEDNNAALVYLDASSAFIMEEGTLITGNINTNVTATSAGGVQIFSSGNFTMKGGIISGNSSVSSNAGGGVHLSTTTSVFRISNGIITGNEPYTPPGGTIPLAANTAPNIGSALRITNGTVQYGTFNGTDWEPNGRLTTRHTTIHVVNGEVLIPIVTNAYEWQSVRDTISNSGNGSVGNPRTYNITVRGNVNGIEGSTANTFGSAANIDITITGENNATLNLSSVGSLLRIGDNQTVTIRDITLQGLGIEHDNNTALVLVGAPSANFIMEDGTLITGNNNTNVTASSAGGVSVFQGIFTMKGGIISGNSSASSATGGGGVHLSTTTSVFRISNGIITGNEPYTSPGGTTPLAANTAPNIGSALRITNGSVQYGTFNGADWAPNGSLATRHTTIHAVNGEILIPIITNAHEWQSARDTISNSGSGDVGNPRTYSITVRGDITIAGITTSTFGSASFIDVTITGENNAALNLSSQGSLLRIGANQTVTIRDIALKGIEENNNALVFLNVGSAHFIMDEGTLITGNRNILTSTISAAGGVYITNGTFTMKGGIISGNSSVSSTSSGGVHLHSGIFRFSNGIITGNMPYTPPNETTPLAANTAPSGSAFNISGGTAQYGTFTGIDGAWAFNGNLTTRHTAIHVVDGEVLIPIVTNAYEWQSVRDTISNSNSGVAGNPRTYAITVRGNINDITGVTNNTFGSATHINVIITGENNASLNLSSQGSLLRIGTNQIVTIKDIALKGIEENNNALVFLNVGSAHFIMEDGTLISGNRNTSTGSTATGGVYISNGFFTMKGGIISGNSSATNNISGGGLWIGGPNSFFQISNGIIVGNTPYTPPGETIPLAANTALNGSAFYRSDGTAQYGAFSVDGGAWVSNGSLTTRHTTIHLIEGVLLE